MNLNVDHQQQVKEAIGSLAPSHLWVLGLAVDEDGSLIGPGMRRDSYLTECQCPDDCLRDHENE
jgi:hypothetical protein